MSQPLEVSDPAAGTVDWKGAEQFMQGKLDPDGEEAGTEPSSEPTVKEFKYRGKTIKVADPELYETLESLRREARSGNGRLGSELAQARERLAKLEGMVAARQQTGEETPDIKPPDPLLATRDITAWQRQWEQYSAAREARLQADLEKKYLSHVEDVHARVTEKQKQDAWASRFYAEYSHLDHPDIKPVVAQVFAEHGAELKALDPDEIGTEEVYERLADLADARLVRLKNAGRGVSDTTNNNPRRPPRIESSAGPTPRGKAEDKPREFSAASWVAQQRLKMQGREPKK